jgi:hypothetical protein
MKGKPERKTPRGRHQAGKVERRDIEVEVI